MDFDRAVGELEALVTTLEREGDERALLLLELVDAIHRPALERIAAGDARDPIARAVLEMYGIGEVDEALLVEGALDEVRPYIESHGGAVELVQVEGGKVHVRMSGACNGCAASAMTLQRGIEAALREHYPGFEEVVAEPPEEDSSFTQAPPSPLLQIENTASLRRPQFVGIELEGIAPETMAAREVDGISLLVINHGGEVFAFHNRCPVDDRRLEEGNLSDGVVVCPWHNCAYDARSGRRVDEDAAGLAVVPIALDGGAARVAVNVL